MEKNVRKDLLLKVADLGLKQKKDGLTEEEKTSLQECLLKLDLSFEDAIREAEKLLTR